MFLSTRDISKAKLDVKKACDKGQTITLRNSGLGIDDLELKSFPVLYTPFPRKLAGNISWVEDCDIACYVSKLAITDLGYTVSSLCRYEQVVVGRISYDIKNVDFYGSIGDDYTYILIGGAKK